MSESAQAAGPPPCWSYLAMNCSPVYHNLLECRMRVLPLSTTHTQLRSCTFSITHLFILVVLETSAYHTAFFPLKHLYMQIFIAGSCWSGSWFLEHHKYWTFAKSHLGYPALALSQGDLAARQASGGRFHVSSGLLHISPGMTFVLVDL